MNDDWRLQIEFVDEGPKDHLLDRLDAKDLEHDLSEAFHDRVIVSRNGTTIFLYAGNREQAEKARSLVERLTREDEEEVEIDFKRWHPTAEDWEDPDKPLPAGAAAKLAEHRRLIERERTEAEKQGRPEFEVRVDLPSRREAIDFAERIEGEAPSGSQVKAEGTWLTAYAERPHSPFSFLGGLAE